MPMGPLSIGALWRYPVKSLQGREVDRLEVGTTGIVGDRAWGIVDPAAEFSRAPALNAV